MASILFSAGVGGQTWQCTVAERERVLHPEKKPESGGGGTQVCLNLFYKSKVDLRVVNIWHQSLDAKCEALTPEEGEKINKKN